MPVKILQGYRTHHPITELVYRTVTKSYRFGGADMIVEYLADVEAAIDHVFAWLKERNLPDEEIEHLAPYFGTVWPSAMALAEWVAREGAQTRLRGKRILEIGCGLALPSFVAVHYGAKALASDSHPDVLRFLQKNILLNGDLAIDFIVAEQDGSLSTAERFDYVIGSDVLYESQHVEIFSSILDRYSDSQTKIVIADPGRAYIQSFVKKMNACGWQENLAPWTVRHNGKDQDIYVLTFERS